MSRATRWKGSVKMGVNYIGAVVFVLFAVLWHLSQDWQACLMSALIPGQ